MLAARVRRAGRMWVSEARLKHFGWGREGEGATAEEEAFARARAAQRFGGLPSKEVAPPRLDEIKLSAPRLTPPAALADICSSETYDRAAHSYGKSYPELARGLVGDYANAPDVVAYPRSEAAVAALLVWSGGGCVRGVGRRRGGVGDAVGRRLDGCGRRRAEAHCRTSQGCRHHRSQA